MSLRYYAHIDRSGAIVLNGTISCDAYFRGVTRMVITHAHRDHIKGFQLGIRRGVKVISTRATRDLLSVLANENPYRIQGLDYGERLEVEGGTIWLARSSHMLGAAQVVFEHEGGIRVVYTGDFRQPGTPIIESDILVMEATYGKPEIVRPPREKIYEAFVALVKSCLKKGPVNVIAYHGKLQEAMEVIRAHIPEIPFLAPRKVWLVSSIAARYGMRLGEVIPMNSIEGIQIARSNWYIAFLHSSMCAPRKGSSLILTGWCLSGIVRKLASDRYVVALSGHADFRQLLEYVEESKPKFVIVDGSRSSYAEIFAKEIRRRLKIEAVSMP